MKIPRIFMLLMTLPFHGTALHYQGLRHNHYTSDEAEPQNLNHYYNTTILHRLLDAIADSERLRMDEIIAQTFSLQKLGAYLVFGHCVSDLTTDMDHGGVTMIMPWDLAFELLDAKLIAKMQSRSWIAHTRDFLHYHMIDHDLPVESLPQGQDHTVTTMNGQDVQLTLQAGTKSRVKINQNEASVIAYMACKNGNAYMTDKVLRPAWLESSLWDYLAGTFSSGADESTGFSLFVSYIVKFGLDELLQDRDESLTI